MILRKYPPVKCIQSDCVQTEQFLQSGKMITDNEE